MSVSGDPNSLERGQINLPANREKDEHEQGSQDQQSPYPNEQWDWETDPHNPYNWPASRKAWQIAIVSSMAFTASFGTSVMTAAPEQLINEFGVTTTQSILPLSLYVFALALGPVIGGPLSETIGRYYIFMIGVLIGALFAIGCGTVQTFAGLCILRFLSGLFFAPTLAISGGTLNEIYKPEHRGIPSTFFITTPLLGPGFGPVIGGFVTQRKGWRWTQWTIIFFSIFSLLLGLLFGRETFHPILKKRKAKQVGQPIPPPPPLRMRLKLFMTVALFRPLLMLAIEPITTLFCLYSALEFATLFSFFAAIPYVFQEVYHFSTEQVGLVFVSIIIGCVLGAITLILCNKYFYLPQVTKYPPHQVPPEHRLYAAMIGSIGLPLGLFWFGWTSKSDISWASPAVAIIPFTWGNFLARYILSGAFPLFTTQMYRNLGIGWASSLLGFFAVALLPVPWIFFKFGKLIRSKSRYEASKF
ncbi:major facilitator superfamily domain-containing protein [Trichoderma breve]|uniref:Major facilitator superfamily domain-containing protein n=1 Tax=Trichoderma breve TaxID=2034170 RepID=A0A9W9E483_9HYPO|nr:major facilitator superfamily domain-containing protein [Trichoderma breve]KAJ4856730.1 major facilitator superfamily domain-containing protein [Trichoderma breve]